MTIVVGQERKPTPSVSCRNTDEYGIDNVAAVIIRNDNPNLAKVLSEFGDTIGLFSNKPNLNG